MVDLENANNIGRPSSDTVDYKETNNARDHAQNFQSRWDGKDAQTDLRLHHEDDGSYEPDLVEPISFWDFFSMRTACINIAKVGTVLRDLSEYIIMDVFGLLRHVFNVFLFGGHVEGLSLDSSSWRKEGRKPHNEKAKVTLYNRCWESE